MNEFIIQMENIEKSYGKNKVLHSVNFNLKPGEIHALLGENGTGKTTLMNILGGLTSYDSGNIIYQNELLEDNQKNKNYLKSKIAFVHQELALIPDLSVYENLFYGQEIRNGLLLDNNLMKIRTKEILSKLNVDINPDIIIKDLDASYQQIIEISKAVMKDAKVIILDEPTTSLSENEIEEFFLLLKKLKERNIAIIFISHKLNEVLEICDTYTVLRDGYVVKNGKIENSLHESDIAKYMVGKDVDSLNYYRDRKLGDIILETKNLTRADEFRDVTLYIRKGEIVGVTGLLGDGRSELFETIYGNKERYSGDIVYKGELIKSSSTSKSVDRGISYVPRNRKVNSIIKDASISDNLSISSFRNMNKLGFIDNNALNKQNSFFKSKLNIKLSDFNDLITSLSGGNQQKVIISRAMSINPSVIIFDNPTQGVDIGAKFEIYNHILNLAEEGISFFVLSNEANEIIALCDRAYVMFHGEVRAELKRDELTEENIMTLATGGYLNE